MRRVVGASPLSCGSLALAVASAEAVLACDWTVAGTVVGVGVGVVVAVVLVLAGCESSPLEDTCCGCVVLVVVSEVSVVLLVTRVPPPPAIIPLPRGISKGEPDAAECPIALAGDWTTLMAVFEAELGGGPEGAKPVSKGLRLFWGRMLLLVVVRGGGGGGMRGDLGGGCCCNPTCGAGRR